MINCKDGQQDDADDAGGGGDGKGSVQMLDGIPEARWHQLLWI